MGKCYMIYVFCEVWILVSEKNWEACHQLIFLSSTGTTSLLTCIKNRVMSINAN